MRVIDTHAHFWPERLLEYISAGADPALRIETEGGLRWLIHEAGLRYPLTPEFFDLDAKLVAMDRDGIDVAFDSIPAPYFFYELEPAATLEASQLFNDEIAAHARASGGRVEGLATIPLNDPEAAAEEIRRAREELGLVGVEIGTSLDDVALDDRRFDPLFDSAERHRMPLMLHPYLSMLSQRLPLGLDSSMLPVILANPVETTAAAARLVTGGVFDRFPDLTVQLVHGGGYYPFQLGRLQRAAEINPALAEAMERSPADYLDNMIFDTVIFEPHAVDFLIDVAGRERVVLGTDQPFLLSDLTLMNMDGLDEATRPLLLEENAKRAFNLGD